MLVIILPWMSTSPLHVCAHFMHTAAVAVCKHTHDAATIFIELLHIAQRDRGQDLCSSMCMYMCAAWFMPHSGLCDVSLLHTVGIVVFV